MTAMLHLAHALRSHASRSLFTSTCATTLALGRHAHNASASPKEDGLLVVPFPKLSHTMETGRLVKWHKQPGEWVNIYDVLFEVATDQLTEEVFKVGNFAGTVHLLVESQEEGWLAQIYTLADDKAEVQVGTPVGIICEEEAQKHTAQAFKSPTTNVYDDKQPAVQVLMWQSFLKQGTSGVKCMG